MNEDIRFKIPFPKIGTGRAKNQLVTINNSSVWKRYYEVKIKKQLKDDISGWVLPEAEFCDEKATATFTIFRSGKKRQDADSAAYIGKWIVDLLVQRGYLKDDDKVTFVYEPVTRDSSLVEVMLGVHIRFD